MTTTDTYITRNTLTLPLLMSTPVGALSNAAARPSVSLSVCLPVCLSVPSVDS